MAAASPSKLLPETMTGDDDAEGDGVRVADGVRVGDDVDVGVADGDGVDVAV